MSTEQQQDVALSCVFNKGGYYSDFELESNTIDYHYPSI